MSDIQLLLFFIREINALHRVHRITDQHYDAMLSHLYWANA